jgi:hypothetical protein
MDDVELFRDFMRHSCDADWQDSMVRALHERGCAACLLLDWWHYARWQWSWLERRRAGRGGG